MSENLPAIARGSMTIGGKTYVFEKAVTRTVLEQKEDVPFFVTFESAFRPSDMDPKYSQYKNKDTGEASVPVVADVINLETGEIQILIGNTVMVSELTKKYPDNNYVGRSFGMRRTRSERDRRYRVYDIMEIKPEGTSTAPEYDVEGADAPSKRKARKPADVVSE